MSPRPSPTHHALEDLRAISDLLEALTVANKATQFRIRRRSLALLSRIQRSTLDRLSVAISQIDATSATYNGVLPTLKGSDIDA